MKKALIVIGSLGLAVSCRPAQKDPPLNFEHVRQDAKVSELKFEPESPLAQMGVTDLWAKTTGKSADGGRIKIGLVGTGIDYTIPDLRDSLAVNLGEYSETARSNQLDDDQNGYPDDVIGYDFFSGDANPYDWHGHDTIVASIIAATSRNNSKVVGVAPNAELVVARYIGPEGKGSGMDAIPALEYVIDSGAKIIYFNWPDGGFDAASTALIVDTIKAAAVKNVLFVIPAGNSANQRVPLFLKLLAKAENVVIVAGLEKDGKLTQSTNFGRNLATLAAPANSVPAYLPGGQISQDLKTSAIAAGYATGAAALLASLPGMGNVQKIRMALLNSSANKKATDIVDVLAGGSIYLGAK